MRVVLEWLHMIILCCTQDWSFRIIDIIHISSWKGPITIIESNTLLLTELPKPKPYWFFRTLDKAKQLNLSTKPSPLWPCQRYCPIFFVTCFSFFFNCRDSWGSGKGGKFGKRRCPYRPSVLMESVGWSLLILVDFFKLRIFCDSVSLIRVADRKQLCVLGLRAARNYLNWFFRKA